MKILSVIFILLTIFINSLAVQDARIRKIKMKLNTYMFSDPDPVPKTGRIYPYFQFDGFTNHSSLKEWNMILMENDYIKVYICPDIGGKIWGAIEKSTGKEFLYFNHSVKFRDIAMRGPWTSGGMEFNFGDIGHIPTCATPVDFIINKHKDGSVSCVVGAIDLPSGNRWNVKVILEKDKAYFDTKTAMFNNTSLPGTFYHWMNAAAKSSGNLEFLYPGNRRIGHGGEPGKWPLDKGKKISMYENNNFGPYKSYHIINSYSNYFGGYWHDDDFGFGHISDFDEKPGRKIWIWGLSDQGMIWEDLLTDSDGQYIEYQTGKLFNQAGEKSTYSPFKHREFVSYDSDIMNETWFPIKETRGMVAASQYAVLNVIRKEDQVQLLLSALQEMETRLSIFSEQKRLVFEKIKLQPLKLYKKFFTINKNKNFSIELGDGLLKYSTAINDSIVGRPVEFHTNFKWDSSYGLFIKALELEKQRQYSKAMEIYKQSLKIEPTFLPALSRMALGYYRKMDYPNGQKYAERAMSINTYDPLANYVYGLTGIISSKNAQAKSGFSIASQSIEYRSASFAELAKLFFREKDLRSSRKYSEKALSFNVNNINALEILALSFRKDHKHKKALEVLSRLYKIDPLNHFINFEKFKLKKTGLANFKDQISNELFHESFLDLAIRYYQLGCSQEAIEVLNTAPEHPVVLLWMSYLDKKNQNLLKDALNLSAEMVFPHRFETAKMLEYFMQFNGHWKLKYYSALIYWNKGLIDKAKKMFQYCKDKPEFFAFYLAKMKLFDKDQLIRQNSLKKARDLSPDSWRVNLAWINYYMDKKNYKNAEKIAGIIIQKYPENSLLALTYTKTLLKSCKYEQGISFLESYNFLPYEGAIETRKIYHTLCIRSAYEELKKDNYTEVIKLAKKAKLWPKNLGVGKPYIVDEKLDDFLIAYSYEKLKEKPKDTIIQKINIEDLDHKLELVKDLLKILKEL